MSKISIITLVIFLGFNTTVVAKNFKSTLLPNLNFELPDKFEQNEQIVINEMGRLQKVAPDIYKLMETLGTQQEAYADPSIGDVSKNNIFFSARKLKNEEYYEVKSNQMAQNVCQMMTMSVKKIYNIQKNLQTYKCYKMKYPDGAKWGLYQELEHPDFDGRYIYMLFIDQNLNEIGAAVNCEFKNCNKLRLYMANMIKSLKYN